MPPEIVLIQWPQLGESGRYWLNINQQLLGGADVRLHLYALILFWSV